MVVSILCSLLKLVKFVVCSWRWSIWCFWLKVKLCILMLESDVDFRVLVIVDNLVSSWVLLVCGWYFFSVIVIWECKFIICFCFGNNVKNCFFVWVWFCVICLLMFYNVMFCFIVSVIRISNIGRIIIC